MDAIDNLIQPLPDGSTGLNVPENPLTPEGNPPPDPQPTPLPTVTPSTLPQPAPEQTPPTTRGNYLEQALQDPQASATMMAITAPPQPPPDSEYTPGNYLEGPAADSLLGSLGLNIPGTAKQVPSAPSPYAYGPTRQAVEKAPGEKMRAYDVPNKDKLAYLDRFKTSDRANLSQLKDPVLDGVFNMAKMAERDGYQLAIESGKRDGKGTSYHNYGEAVDVNFKDRKGNYLDPTTTIELAKKYGDAAGFGSMIDEYSHPSPGATGPHAHLAWTNEAMGMEGVSTFRRRDRDSPGYNTQLFGGSPDAAGSGKVIKAAYLPKMIETLAATEGVPPDMLVRLIQTESNFNPNAVNASSGAWGLGQFMPATAKEIADRNGWTVDQMKANPLLQIRGAAQYLKQNLEKYGGNMGRAAAAYNAGPGNVDDMIAGKIKPFKETQDYVAKVMGSIDPAIKDGAAAGAVILNGGGRQWVPGLDQDAAKAHLQTVADAHNGMMSKIFGYDNFGDFAQSFGQGLTDPNNPGSLAYNKSFIPQDDKNPNLAAGAVNAYMDTFQDILHGLSFHWVPSSERSKEIGSWSNTPDFLQKALSFGSSQAGNITGGVAMAELAAAKLFGNAAQGVTWFKGLRGAAEGTGEGGILAGTPLAEMSHSMHAVAATAFTDGTLSTLMDWYKGEALPGATSMQAVGHALMNGAFASSMSIIAGVGGAFASHFLPAAVTGTTAGMAKTLGEVGEMSPARQMGLGFLLGGGTSAIGNAVASATGLSQAMFGGDIPMSDAILTGGLSGAIGAPLTTYISPKLMPRNAATDALKAKATTVLEAHQYGTRIHDAVLKQALEVVGRKNDNEILAGGSAAGAMLDQHVDRMTQDTELAARKISMQQSAVKSSGDFIQALQKQQQTMEAQAPSLTKRYQQAQGQYEILSQEAAQATQKIQQMTATGAKPDEIATITKARDSALDRATKIQQNIETNKKAIPALNQYADLLETIKTKSPEHDKLQGDFQQENTQYQQRKLGSDFFLTHAKAAQQGLNEGLNEWRALQATGEDTPGGAAQFFSNKLKEEIQRPSQNTNSWSMDMDPHAFATSQTGRAKEVRELSQQLYREALGEHVQRSIQMAGDLNDDLSLKVNQAMKMFTPDSYDQVAFDPEHKALIKSIRDSSGFLEGVAEEKNGDWDLSKFSSPSNAYKELQASKFRYDIPEAVTNADGQFAKVPLTGHPDSVKQAAARNFFDPKAGVFKLSTDVLTNAMDLGEAFKTFPGISTDGFYQSLGQNKAVKIPLVKDQASFTDLLAHAKAAQQAGQDWVPVKGDPKQIKQMLNDFVTSVKPDKATLEGLQDSMRQHFQEYGKSVPLAQKGSNYDVSRQYSPDNMTNQIHATMKIMGQDDRLHDAIVAKDQGAVNKILVQEDRLVEQQFKNLLFTEKEALGWGKFDPTKNSQTAVATSNFQNEELGLNQDTSFQRNSVIDGIVKMISSPGESDVLTLDAAQKRLTNEAIQGYIKADKFGRGPGDVNGIALMMNGENRYHYVQGMKGLTDQVISQYEGVLKESHNGLKLKGFAKDQFNKDLIGVLEDSGKYPQYLEKYGDKGKAAIFHANEIKSVLETMSAGSPDLADYRRAGYMAARFPKAANAYLDSLGGVNAGFKSGLSRERLRSFGTQEAFQEHIEAQKKRIADLGYDPKTYGQRDLNSRINELIPSPRRDNMSAAELEKVNEPLYNRLTSEADEVSNAHLYDTTDDDPANVLRRQFESTIRAQGVRRFMTQASNTMVDTGGQKGQPNMKPILYARKPGETTIPEHTYDDGSKKPYKVVSGITGFDGFETMVAGKMVSSNDLFLHPEAYDHMVHTATSPLNKLTDSAPVRAWNQFISLTRGLSLIGGFLPHLRQMMTTRLSENIFAPLRALAGDTAGRALLDGSNRDYQLAVFNAVRSGVNVRSLQDATRGVMQSMIDSMGPEAANRFYGVDNNKVVRYLQALNPADPANKMAYNQLGMLGKLSVDVLGAPLQYDHIMMREGVWKNIEAGMVGGFYQKRAQYEQQYAKELSGLSPEARASALDKIASQVVNSQAAALPYYMQSTLVRHLAGSSIMSPNWCMGKANMILDGMDGLLGLAQTKMGIASPDQKELADVLKSFEVKRKYAGYSPEVKQAIRSRMAATIGGGLFATVMGLQVAQHMLDGTTTFTHAPDKYFSLKVGDQYMSGVGMGHIRDILQWVTGVASGKPFEKAVEILGRNLIPTDRAVGQLIDGNKDEQGRQIVGDYRGGFLESNAAKAKDLAGFLAKSFVRFDDTLGYKNNTQLSTIMDGSITGAGGLAPNSMTAKQYALQQIGVWDSKDNWASSQRFDMQERQAFYRNRLESEVRNFVEAARLEKDPKRQQALLSLGSARAMQGVDLVDNELKAHSADGKYRMTPEQYGRFVEKTFDPTGYAMRQERTSMAGGAFAEKQGEYMTNGPGAAGSPGGM